MPNRNPLPFPVPLSVAAEFADADFGDARLSQRLVTVASRMASSPAESFPKTATSPSDLEATYRFFRNERVTSAAILAPHLAATRERAKSVTTLLSIEDTTEARFGGTAPREGLGSLMNGGQGFFLHASLLVGLLDDDAVPLGLGGYEILTREEKREKPTTKAARQAQAKKVRADPNREAKRWLRVAQATDEALKLENLEAIHVADREGDNYDFFGPLAKSRFVIRMAQPRVVASDVEGFVPSPGQPRPQLDDAVVGLTVRAKRSVHISAQVTSGGRRRAATPRASREAELELTATTVTLRPPPISDFKEPVTLNVVQVTEVNVPEGEEPVSWRLLTTEPISTEAEVCRIVDMYRARWLIEEFFKALKTGCGMEDRQLETKERLENALAVEIPIAWQMLALRHAARSKPQAPASSVLPAAVISLLVFMATTPGANRWGIKLAKHPTAKEALWAIARIGGHLPNNGDPGWLTIRRGFDDVMTMLTVWPRCDQS